MKKEQKEDNIAEVLVINVADMTWKAGQPHPDIEQYRPENLVVTGVSRSMYSNEGAKSQIEDALKKNPNAKEVKVYYYTYRYISKDNYSGEYY